MELRRVAAAVVFSALVASVTPAATKEGPLPPTADRIPALASTLAESLRDTKVVAPDGAAVAVASVLDAKRWEAALATIGEAGAWPAAWLVVQDLGRPWDLVLRVRLTAAGDVEVPEPAFIASRREWDDAAFDEAFRVARGAKPPRDRNRNVVVQAFAKRTVTTFVYDLPKTGKDARGLMALLPEGSLLRESHAVRWADGRLLTLALVLVRPKFVPSACGRDGSGMRDHADSGGVTLYITSETAVEGSVDLTERFREEEAGEPLVPHWGCLPGDDDPVLREISPADRFEGRDPVRLMEASRPADGRDEIVVRIVGVDRGRGRRDRAIVRITRPDPSKPFLFALD